VLVTANYVKLWGSPFWSGPTMALLIGAVMYPALEHEGRDVEVASMS
jgi:hypothetical protein